MYNLNKIAYEFIACDIVCWNYSSYKSNDIKGYDYYPMCIKFYFLGKCVVALDWNPLNEDILAVGYGKFYFTDSTTGIIMIWNIKNPVQPERHYDISAAITSLQFSKQHCNLLAIGLADGKVEILDISKREKTVLHKCSPKDSMNFEPVWQVLCLLNGWINVMEFFVFTSCLVGFNS